ncbi:acyltransferase family protein [Plantibacter sp. YIM 135347]|uniref:acyltransferase family protein n=1 Tax=Plantibacter sp. YIM 135347 TaxID=3423919 RepID=UPI003D338620
MNNFAALRMFGALLVLIRHSMILLDDQISPIGAVGPDDIPPLGLWIFFVTAGFLLPASWSRRPHLLRYVSARVLRIFPGLLLALVVTVLGLGMIATTESPMAYLRDPGTVNHLASNLVLDPNFSLPGVFPANPYPVVVNGALWSLAPLFALYLVVPVFGSIPWRSARVTVWATLFAYSLVAPAVAWVDTSAIIWGSYSDDILRVTAFFCAGVLLRELRVPLSSGIALGAGSVFMVILVGFPALAWPVAHVVVPYVIVTIGSASTPVLRAASRYGDPSYGMFLIGFPVQQFLIWAAPELDWVPSILLTVGISAAFGYLLWWTVDIPIRAIQVRPSSIVGVSRDRRRTGSDQLVVG